MTVDCEFALNKFTTLQKEGGCGDWYSDPFSISGYNLQLNVETKQRGPMMKVRLRHASFVGALWSVTFVATVQLLNQLCDQSHYSKQLAIKFGKECRFSDACEYIAFQQLYWRDRRVQYLKDDSLKLRMWIKIANNDTINE